jgi:hypothetical protein
MVAASAELKAAAIASDVVTFCAIEILRFTKRSPSSDARRLPIFVITLKYRLPMVPIAGCYAAE